MSFFKNLFSRHAATAEAEAPARRFQGAPARPLFPAPPPQPVQVRKQPEPVAASKPEPVAASKSVGCITLPLKVITDLFTPELNAALRKHPSEHVQAEIPRALIEPQLATGAIRITFEQLRAAAPEIFFNAEAAPADAKVQLPLDLVLRQIMPARREDQRPPSIPVSVPSIFARAGQGRPDGNGRANGENWYSQRRPSYEAPPETAAAAETPAPVSPPPGLRMPSAPPAAAPTPAPIPAPKPPAPPAATAPLALEKTNPPPAPEPVVRVPETALPGTFALPLVAFANGVTPEIREALDQAPGASLIIPSEEFEVKMRTGKLLFRWWQLREWCNEDLPSTIDAETAIELPLAAVAPLFMASRKSQAPRKQVQVDPRIPDVFAQTKTVPAAPPEPPAAVAAPSPPPAAPETPVAPSPPPPAKTGPAVVVNRICAVEGVTGAFLATGDGLLVAGNVPDARGDLLAAFAPTVFAQLTKFSDMARLGVPESAEIHLAGATIHVRKLGKLYLGVLLPAGQPIPAREITTISSDLKPLAS